MNLQTLSFSGVVTGLIDAVDFAEATLWIVHTAAMMYW